jgi:hypothetical protein
LGANLESDTPTGSNGSTDDAVRLDFVASSTLDKFLGVPIISRARTGLGNLYLRSWKIERLMKTRAADRAAVETWGGGNR